MTEIQQEAIKVALNDMMREGRFSIITIRKCLEITRGVPNGDDMRALELLHCVKFKDFSPRLKLEFPRLLERVLQSPAMELQITFKPLNPARLLIET